MRLIQRFACLVPIFLGMDVSFAQPAPASFVPLFNGRDLTGWVEMPESSGAFEVVDGTLALSKPQNYPNWLRTEKRYENFILRLEYMTLGWSESGIFLHAPRYGRASRSGIKIHLKHSRNQEGARTAGSLYDVQPPLVVANRPSGEWNQLEVVMDWPALRVSLNGEVIHNVNMDESDLLRWRLRSGYIGFQDLGTRIRFRQVEIQELPGKQEWTSLFNGTDFSGWQQSGDAEWSIEDGRIVAEDGSNGYLISDQSFSRFEFQVYVRTSPLANGGIFLRWKDGENRGYEIQLYNVPDCTNPTGSIYDIVPAREPDSRDGEWFLMQIISEGKNALVLVDGKIVARTDALEIPDEGRIALQMHKQKARIEFLEPRIRGL